MNKESELREDRGNRTGGGIDRLSASTNRYPAHFRLLRGECSQMPGKKSQELKHSLRVFVLEGSA